MAGEPVRVLTTSSIPEGEIAKARLEDEGIPVFLTGEGEGPYRMGPVHLFVPPEFEVQARLILEARPGAGRGRGGAGDPGLDGDEGGAADAGEERPGAV